MISRIFLALFLLFFSVYSFSQDDKLLLASTIPLELKANANAVVRLNNFQVLIESQSKMKIVSTRIITVLNEKGNQFVQAYSGYDNYVKIKKIEAAVFDEEGEELKEFKKRDFMDYSAVDGGTLYSDSRVLFMPYTPTSYPYTVKFELEIETKNTAGIQTWRPVSGYYLSIENEKYDVYDNANLGLRYKENNFDGLEIESNNSDSSLNYELHNFEALRPEILSPKESDLLPNVMVAVNNFHFYGVDGSATNWQEFGDWIANSLLEGRDQVSEKTKMEILDLVKGFEDPIEKAKLVHKYVQNNTRYISVQVGIGGVQPIEAIEVDKVKYGDCKGLTNYTHALLKVAGVPSYYSVVEAGSDIVDFDESFYSLEQGNHIILAIPHKDELIWVDCTSQVHPFGFIGDFTDNRNVLLVNKGKSRIVKTSEYVNSDNFQNTSAKVVLRSDAGLSSDMVITTKGVKYDNRFYLESQSDKDIRKYYKNQWDKINYLEIEKYKFENNKVDVVFKEKLKIEVLDYAVTTNDRLIFRPNIFNANSDIPIRYRNRVFPVEIQRGYLEEDKIEILIPDDFKIEYIPEDLEINSDFGTYKTTYLQNDKSILYKRKLLIKKGTYPSSKYSDYREFKRKISKSDKSKIILNKQL